MPDLNVVNRLSNYIITDGFHVVVDPDKSHGSWIVDAQTGRSYLDCYSQFASQPLGWNHKALLKAKEHLGNAALHKIANSDMYSVDYVEFVEKFAEITPDFSHYFFIDGGALAVENALKAAFDWKAQKSGIRSLSTVNELDVVHFYKAFHGRTGYTLSLTNTELNKTKLFPQFNWNTIYDIDKLDTYMHSEVAAIIVEPIQGEGGDNHFHPQVFHELRSLADTYDSMLIFDEVQTGLGGTGKMWAYEHAGVVPDMMCFGKKTQVCGFCSTNRIDEIQENVFSTSGRINSTWGGNIVDMVRSKYIIETIQEEKLVEKAANVGKYFLSQLLHIKGLQNVRGKGLMIAFDLETTAHRDKLKSIIQEQMLVLTCGTKSIRLRPVLTFSEEDVERACEIIEDSLSRLEKEI